MTTFQDGPAQGQRLMLKRAAMFLRVTECNGKWDALDQLNDRADHHEKLYAYRIVGVPGHCHINASGGRGGFYPVATYQFYDPQPTDSQMRDTGEWANWVFETATKETK